MAERGRFTRVVYARIAPNEDLVTAVETVCAGEAIAAAYVRGSLGSLTDACFERAEGRIVEVWGPAIEVLSLQGEVRSDGDGRPRAVLTAIAADSTGQVHAGRLVPGRNPVLVTFELGLEVFEEEAG